MGVVSTLKQATGRGGAPDSRAELRAAHAARVAAREALEEHKQAVAQAQRLIERQQRKIERSREAIEQAKGESAALAARAIREGNDTDVNAPLRRARADLVAEEDNLESLQLAYKALQAEGRDRAFEIEKANVEVVLAARALAMPHIRAAVARLREINVEKAKLQGLVRLAQGDGDGFRIVLTDSASIEKVALQKRLYESFGDLGKEAARLSDVTDETNSFNTTQAWRDALAKCWEDPDAPLPAI